MVEELAEAVVRAAGVAARGVASLLTIPETYSAAAEFAAAEADRPDRRRDAGKAEDGQQGEKAPEEG
ncbi:hypothetical protein [Streptomyces sp. NRRL F-5727]|uniref:hypothetical protein n=1 Tax=Streptomyces sp. NRRL F-5727 TaxID=1463871 RepID=UPI00131C09E4|nr:hypothetical protein [Streptomyces sp. NRRL F-5727]